MSDVSIDGDDVARTSSVLFTIGSASRRSSGWARDWSRTSAPTAMSTISGTLRLNLSPNASSNRGAPTPGGWAILESPNPLGVAM